jgi:transposase-like protein
MRTANAKNWSQTEVETIRTMAAAGATKKDVAEALKRNIFSVRLQANKHGIKFHRISNAGRPWSREDEATLRDLAASGIGLGEMSKRLSREISGIQKRCRLLRIKLKRAEFSALNWTPEFIAQIENNFRGDSPKSIREIARSLGVSHATLIRGMARYGIEKQPTASTVSAAARRQESMVRGLPDAIRDAILLDYANGVPLDVMSKRYGRTGRHLAHIAVNAGVRRLTPANQIHPDVKAAILAEVVRSDRRAVQDIAEAHGVAVSSIKKIATRAGVRMAVRIMERGPDEPKHEGSIWTPSFLAQVGAAWSGGVPTQEIMRKFKLTKGMLLSAMFRAGIQRTLAPKVHKPKQPPKPRPRRETVTEAHRAPIVISPTYATPGAVGTRRRPVNPRELAAEMRAAIDAKIAAGAVTKLPTMWASGSFVSIYGAGA